MKFNKLGKKLSAILCSAMYVVEGLNIFNYVAMAGGIILDRDITEIDKYGYGVTIENEKLTSWIHAFDAYASGSGMIVLGNEDKSSEFNGRFYAFTVGYKNESIEVRLYLIGENGFAASFGDNIKFGVLPFTYFIYSMEQANISLNDFRTFDEMDEKIKFSFLNVINHRILNSFYTALGDYAVVCEYFFEILSNVKSDIKGFGDIEDNTGKGKNPISVCCIDAFKKAYPRWKDDTLVFHSQVATMQLPPIINYNNSVPKGEKNKKGLPSWFMPVIGVPIVASVGILTGVLINKYKKGNSKINDTQKEIFNKTFLGKKRKLSISSENAKTVVTSKAINNRRNANQRKYAVQFKKGFKQLKKQGSQNK